jgi:ABC-type sugar transport system ATPase subunit
MGDKGKIVKWRDVNARAVKILGNIGYSLDVKRTVDSLSVAEKQLVEIAKALSFNAKLILMDEPSATLTSKEIEKFFNMIRKLKEQKITIIYISHKLDEVFELCDTTTVLRDGKVIDSKATALYTKDELIQKMVGRTVKNEFPARTVNKFGDEVMRVENLFVKNKIYDVSFSLKKSEILGIVGLVGSGRTELVRAVFGADKKTSGNLYINGIKKDIKNPKDAIENGVVLLTEDRRGQGLFVNYPVKYNISSAGIKKILKGIFLSNNKEVAVAREYIEELKIKCTSENQAVSSLSGGNQQKVVIAKWLYSIPEVFIMDEPTKGIDVGAKYEIYTLMNKLTEQGKSVIFISSEIQEVLSMSDRIIVLYSGRLKGEFLKEDIVVDNIIKQAIGQ